MCSLGSVFAMAHRGEYYAVWQVADVPVLFRFEDILANPEEELQNLFKFILGLESIEGTVLEKRITDVMALGSKKNQTYKPRQGGVNRNLANYLPE